MENREKRMTMHRYKSWHFMALFLYCIELVYSQDTTEVMEITISDLYQLADQNSKAIQSALAEKSIADYKVSEAKSAKLPDIKLSIDAAYLADIGIVGLGNMPNDFYSMPNFYNDYGIEAAWVLYAGGNIKRAVDLASLGKKISETAVNGTRSGVRLMLAGLFTNLYVAQNQQKVLEKNIEQTSLLLQNMANRLKAGIILESDYIRYELQLSNLKFTLSKINNSIKKISKNISETLGLQPGKVLYAITSETDIDNKLLSTADISNNTEVIISTINEQILEKNLEINRNNLQPTVTLFATNNFSRPFIYDIPAIDIYSNVSLVGVNVSFDIGKLYKNKPHVSVAKMELEKSRINKQLIAEEKKITLHDAIVDYNESVEHLEVADKELDLATKNYNLIVNQYNNELALITDVMDASNTKLNAELQLENARAAIIFAYYKTQHITGNL